MMKFVIYRKKNNIKIRQSFNATGLSNAIVYSSTLTFETVNTLCGNSLFFVHIFESFFFVLLAQRDLYFLDIEAILYANKASFPKHLISWSSTHHSDRIMNSRIAPPLPSTIHWRVPIIRTVRHPTQFFHRDQEDLGRGYILPHKIFQRLTG